jgi:uncharacterized protein (DUF302 family)
MTDLVNTAVMTARRITSGIAAAGVVLAGLALTGAPDPAAAEQTFTTAAADGVVRTQSAYPFEETVARLKADIGTRSIKFFAEIDQAKLAADASIGLKPSTLLLFGNPPLGVRFLTANPYAGLDWPVRMLVVEDPEGKVWVAYAAFAEIARRYAITDRDAEFAKAAEVAASIAASVSAAGP